MDFLVVLDLDNFLGFFATGEGVVGVGVVNTVRDCESTESTDSTAVALRLRFTLGVDDDMSCLGLYHQRNFLRRSDLTHTGKNVLLQNGIKIIYCYRLK